jgi:hypothetical protein
MIFFWLTAGTGWMLEGMKIQSMVGIVMIIAGAALLAYGGFTTTNREKIIDVGPIKVEADVKERHRVPPVISWAVLGGGVVVLVMGARKK